MLLSVQSPLTSYQRDIWVAAAQFEDSRQFNCLLHERIEGRIDLARLKACVEKVLRRNDALRLRFGEREGTPFQWVDDRELEVGVLDFSAHRDPAAARTGWMRDARRSAFALAQVPLVEATLLIEGPRVVHLHVKAHHLVVDGWALNLFSHQVFAEYTSPDRFTDTEVPSYLEAIEDETTYRGSAAFPADVEFHREALTGVTPALFTRKTAPGQRSTTRHSFTLEGALVDRMRAAGLSPFSYIAAMLGTCLSRLHRTDDVVLGIPFLNRPGATDKKVLGSFANTLPLRVRSRSGQSPRDLTDAVRTGTAALRRHERLALGDVLREASGLPAGSRQLFDVTLSYMRFPRPATIPGTIRETNMTAPAHEQDALAVFVQAFDDVDDVRVDFVGADDVFDADFPIESVAGHLETLLRDGLDRPDEPLSTLPMTTPAEREDLRAGRSQGARVEFPADATLSSLFEAQVARRPGQLAVISDGESLTYAELDARANQVARGLRADGVGAGDRVAVVMERGPAMLVALMGVLKAGGAYVPVDPGYPRERIRFLLSDSRPKAVLVTDRITSDAPDGPPVHRLVDLLHGPDSALGATAGPADLAYVIYTSGSTGKPKGVMVRHDSVVNRLAWMQRAYPLREGDVLLQKTPISFDVSVWELFWWAVEGASVALLPVDGEKDPRMILDAVRAHRVSVLHFVPSMLSSFLDLFEDTDALPDDTRSLRYVFCSGEALPAARVDQFNRIFHTCTRTGPALANLYGPTEATVDVSFHDCPGDPLEPVGRVPIGRPIDNTQLYVLGDGDHLQPVGVPGELCIGGVGVAAGYLDRPELTLEKFTEDPFTPGGRLYRTGDLARWLADGELEYLGRIDGQVKIRGNRVELGEVASGLSAVPGVRDAVVVDRADPARGVHLVGYYVADTEIGTQVLREGLGHTLPEFMIPAYFTRIDRIPLSPNGKADRAALPAPRTGGSTTATEPRTKTETVLAEIFAEVLGADRVMIDDDYYALGGDSILMLKIRALAETRGIRFALADLVRHPTVASLAEQADLVPGFGDERALGEFELVSGVDRGLLGDAVDAYPLTRLQLGLIYHSRRHEKSAVYKDVFQYTLRLDWDEREFRRSFARLVARHPALRSEFHLAGFSEPLQVVRPATDGGLDIADLRSSSTADADAEVRRHVEERRYHEYAFDTAPLYLFRAHVRESTVDLVLSFHHALLDGGSVANLLGELLHDYAHRTGLGIGPAPDTALPSPAHHVRAETTALAAEDHRRYWSEELEGSEPLSLDSFRPHQHPGAGAEGPISRRFDLTAETSEQVRRFSHTHALPVKAVLLAAHCLTLSLMSGNEDITTGLVTHGRPELADGERIAGLFLNTVPIRVNTAAESWLDVAREALRREQGAYPFQRYPLSAIQEDLGGGTIVDTAFNYVHFHQLSEVLGLPGVELVDFRTWEETNFTVLVNAVTDPVDKHLWLRVDGDGRAFTGAQAELFASYYTAVLRRMTGHAHEAPDFAFLAGEPPVAAPPGDTETTVVHRFEQQARLVPDNVAVAMDGVRWTYARLAAASATVAGNLLARGVRPGATVGIAMDRSPETIAVLIGVMKAGAAVMPLDPGYPAKRLADMVEQAGADLVIGDGAPLTGEPARRLSTKDALTPAPGDAPSPVLDPASTAYVLFTSGSTGRPKGVELPHRALANLVAWQVGAPTSAAGGTTLHYAPLSFDVSFQEIFSTLGSGGTLRPVPDDVRQDMPALLRLIRDEDVERVFLPYVALQQLAETADRLGIVPAGLRVIISSGEQLRVTDEIRRLCAALPGVVLENQYGPTETHVATRFTMTGDPAAFPVLPPIGTAVDGVTATVLDSRSRPVPPGVKGELYLGGVCLAHGYKGRPELTEERFVEHLLDPRQRLYRTGDLGFVLPGGDIVCAGRADDQLKVRGYRVEPAEVEMAITGLADRYPGIRQAAVVARVRDRDDAVLVAFLTGDPAGVDLEEVKTHLRGVLPDYMVPSAIGWLPAMPLTPSGKRDDAALRAISPADTVDVDTTEPRDDQERALAAILADLLHLPAVGVHANIFDLGATSLTAMRLVVTIEQRYGTSIPLGTLIATPSVAGLAVHLRSAGAAATAFDPLVPIRTTGTRPPLFLVHPMGGNVLCYLPFAKHLPADQPLYALQAAGADPGTQPLGTVEEIASSYVDAIRRVQPEGPYTISGWSFGGFAALEIARQLREAGEEVAHLVLLDTVALRTGVRERYTDDALLGWFFWELLWLERGGASPLEAIPAELTSLDDKFTHIARCATELGVLPPESSGAVIRRLFEVYQANWNAALGYRPVLTGQDVTLVRATEPLPEVLESMHGAAGSQHHDPANGWRAVTTGALRVLDTPGDHLTMMEEPHVETLARLIWTTTAPQPKEN